MRLAGAHTGVVMLLLAKIVVGVVIVAFTVLRLFLLNGRDKQEEMTGMPAQDMSTRARVLAITAVVVVGVVLFAFR